MKEYIRKLQTCPFCHSKLELIPGSADMKGNVMFECPEHDHDNLEFSVWGWWNCVKEIWALNVVINQKQVCFNTHEHCTKILKRTNYYELGIEIYFSTDLIHFIFEKEKFENKIKTLLTFM